MANTFIKITNNQMYEQINGFQRQNAAEHAEIMSMIAEQKSQILRYRWIMGMCFTLVLLNLGWFVSHLL